MADVTINSVKYNIAGSLRDQYYNVSGASGSTLTVGLINVKLVNSEGGIAYTTAPGTISGTTVITLNGVMANTDLQVIGT